MARYHFESALTPDVIRMRISVYAKEAKAFGWQFEPSAFYYRFRRNASFFLVKTHAARFGAVRGQPVFLGTLREKDGKTQIDGRFGVQARWVFPVLLVIAAVYSLCARWIMPLIMAGLFVLLTSGLVSLLGSLLFKAEEQAVLELIEKHLLA